MSMPISTLSSIPQQQQQQLQEDQKRHRHLPPSRRAAVARAIARLILLKPNINHETLLPDSFSTR